MAEFAESKDGPKGEDEEAVSTLYKRQSSPQHVCRRTEEPCLPCKKLLKRLGYSRAADRFFDKGYTNWMRACMVLQYAKEGMEVTAKEVAEHLHACIAANIEKKNIAGNCSGCDIETGRKRRNQECKECTAWIKAIGNYVHRENTKAETKLNWSNTNLKNVKQKPWDLAKLFQGDGCQSHEGPDQSDIAAILSFVSKCNYCVQHMIEHEDDDSDDDNDDNEEFHRLVTKVRTIRNKIYHSNSLKIEDEMILKEHIRDVLCLLKHPKKLKEENTCKEKIQKIEQVRDNKIIPDEAEEQRIFARFVSDMDRKKKSYEHHLESATTAEEYKKIQGKLKKKEDISRRLGVFVDMNVIENPDVRQKLQSIEDECRHLYLEAERRLIETNMKDRLQSAKENYLRTYLRESTPGKPCVVRNKPDQIELTWETPARFDDNGYYEIRYKETSEIKWKHLKIGDGNRALLSDMKGGAGLIFQVRLVTDEVVGPYSEASDEVWTYESAGNILLDKDKLYKDVFPPVYTIPMEEKNLDSRVRQFEIGDPTTSSVELHIWLFGETGSVRTAVIDSMLNFIVGINWDDDYRFTVKTTDCKKTDQNTSNEDYFIANFVIYPSKGSRIKHVVSIMDSPTLEGNIYNDDQTFAQMYELLKGRNVGAICVLVKAQESQINDTQSHSLEAVLSLFGNDLKYNIFALLICSDEADPVVLQTNIISSMGLEKCFVLKNAGLSADHTVKVLNCRDFWRTNWETYIELFTFVCNIQSKTTEKSIHVLENRNCLTRTKSTLKTYEIDCSTKEVDLKYAAEKYPNYEEYNDDDGDDEDAAGGGSVYAEQIIASENMKHTNYYHSCMTCGRETQQRIYCPYCCNPRSRVSYKRKRENMKQHRTKCDMLRKNIDSLKQDISNCKQVIKSSMEKIKHSALHPTFTID